jgi:hypothetical protein
MCLHAAKDKATMLSKTSAQHCAEILCPFCVSRPVTRDVCMCCMVYGV